MSNEKSTLQSRNKQSGDWTQDDNAEALNKLSQQVTEAISEIKKQANQIKSLESRLESLSKQLTSLNLNNKPTDQSLGLKTLGETLRTVKQIVGDPK